MTIRAENAPAAPSRDAGGYLPIEDYGALGDGRAVALSGSDGSIDWWCVPNMDSPPLFDRLLSPLEGGYFEIQPTGPFSMTRRYRKDSNVLETVFATGQGRARLVESLNSGPAGRLPWAELARRVEGLEGRVAFRVRIRFSRQADTMTPYMSMATGHQVFHVGPALGLVLLSAGVEVQARDDAGMEGGFAVTPGTRETLAIVAGADEPLVVPAIGDIDRRIDVSDDEWRQWSGLIKSDGVCRDLLVRQALSLKLLVYSPTGAIAAAATTSLPERIGGDKNYDYRFCWVRDAAYTIRAFLQIGAEAEAKAAFTWLLQHLRQGARVCYTLRGEPVAAVKEVPLPGYRHSHPVVTGNLATAQRQHGLYGDIFETAGKFVSEGNLLDGASAETLSTLADECADAWRRKDSGMWEEPEEQHYTMSKISCWQALTRAVELADSGQLPTTCRDRWQRESVRISEWIEENCWSEELGAYVSYPGTDRLDASLALAVRFGFDGKDRVRRTIDTLDRELKRGAFHSRFSGAEREEGCFLACTFWLAEALALLGDHARAKTLFDDAIAALDRGVGTYSEMADPVSGAFLGNVPQGLTHLAVIQAMTTLRSEPERPAQ